MLFKFLEFLVLTPDFLLGGEFVCVCVCVCVRVCVCVCVNVCTLTWVKVKTGSLQMSCLCALAALGFLSLPLSSSLPSATPPPQSAKDAYRAYLLSYNSHALKEIFNVHRLNMQVRWGAPGRLVVRRRRRDVRTHLGFRGIAGTW